MTRDDAARRSAARERRRAAASGENGRGDGDSGSGSTGGGLEGAARAAAAAAAVGAALGAVKALTQRDDDRETTDRDDQAESAVADEHDDGREDEDDEQPRAAAEEPEDDAPRPQPQRTPQVSVSNGDDDRRPREGASAGTVRSVAARAREQLRDLQGRDADSITALERTRDGWRVTCEVVEVERIPNSTDVLATYVIDLDGDGELVAFERVRRYYRAQADLGGGL